MVAMLPLDQREQEYIHAGRLERGCHTNSGEGIHAYQLTLNRSTDSLHTPCIVKGMLLPSD